MKKDFKLSIVSPVYLAEKIVDELVRRVAEEAAKLTDYFEIILVEDGSPDKSWEKIAENCNRFEFVKGIKLSRNFGQHYAITAGISRAKGDYIILMDCDLQDDPKFIPVLVDEAKKGFDIVFSKRKERKHHFIKSFNSWIYNKLFSIFSEKKYDINAGSFVLFTKQVAQVFLQFKENDRLYVQILKWVGFQNTVIELEHMERFEGKTSYTLGKLLKLGLQGWTSHSDKLLRFSIYLGLTLSLTSFIGGTVIIIKFFFYDLQPGWPSIIVSILFSTGLILLSIGVSGIYIGKIFEQVKGRPLYLVEKELNNTDDNSKIE